MSVTAGERRVVSALVADVASSTAIGEHLGPERSKFLFDEVVRLMRAGHRCCRPVHAGSRIGRDGS
jgi:class 3 adenylate cyclase